MGQVLAELGRVHARSGGEFLAGHGADSPLGQAVEGTQVHRQPCHCGLGYPVGLPVYLGLGTAARLGPAVALSLGT